MRNFKIASVVIAAILVVGGIGASNAGAKFTAAVKGDTITGGAIETQKFTTNAGVVECPTAHVMGTVASTESSEQEVTVQYTTDCRAFGLVGIHISEATLLFTTNLSTPTANTVHILNTITITVTKTLFTGHCTMTIKPQTVGTVHYVNEAGGSVKIVPTLTGIHYIGDGGVCGNSTATNGTYEGASTVMGENGSISVDD